MGRVFKNTALPHRWLSVKDCKLKRRYPKDRSSGRLKNRGKIAALLAAGILVPAGYGTPAAALGAPESEAQGSPLIAASTKDALLVSLGDSITFGENLPASKLPAEAGEQGTPSKDAYPYLVARKENMKAADLGMTGYTSGQLLSWMKQSAVLSKISHAKLITLDIGSNDLLEATYGTFEAMIDNPAKVSPDSQEKSFNRAIASLQSNLQKIFKQVHRQTSAPVILMTLYDPFPDGTMLHEIAEPLLAQANQVILDTAVKERCYLANTYSVMNHRQETLTRISQQDIHPSIAGQQAIAGLLENVILHPEQNQPQEDAVISSVTPVYDQPKLFALREETLEPGNVVAVIGENAQWITIESSRGTGYINRGTQTFIRRPWPLKDSPATYPSQAINFGSISVGTNTKPLQSILWNGVVYSGLKNFAESAGGLSQTDWTDLTIRIQTPAQSGLAGWWSTHGDVPAIPYFWPPFDLNKPPLTKAEAFTLTLRPVKERPLNLTVKTTAFLVEVDGEPVRLNAPVIEIGNSLYVPAAALWQALGGTA